MTNSVEPRRRWFRLNLRAAFVLATALAICFAVKSNQARTQRELAARLPEAFPECNCDVLYDWQIKRNRIWPVVPKWLRELTGDHFFQNVVAVSIQGPMSSGLGMTMVGGKRIDVPPLIWPNSVVDANFFWCKFRDLSFLEGCARLESLHLQGTLIEDASSLEKCNMLRHVTLQDCALNADQLALVRQALPECRIVVTNDATTVHHWDQE